MGAQKDTRKHRVRTEADKQKAREYRQRPENRPRYAEHARNYREKNKIRVKLWKLLEMAKIRAVAKKLEFDLNIEWASKTWTGYCAVSGLAMNIEKKGGKISPTSPSIDRIDQEKGYTKDNCRFVLYGVNALRGNCCDVTMFFIARAIVKNLEGKISWT